MHLSRLVFALAIKLADLVITEIVDPRYEDPIKLKYSRLRLPIALRFIDYQRFNIKKPIIERKYDIGFVGRLEPEKGIREFVLAVKNLYTKRQNIRILIVGSGSLTNFVRKSLSGLHVDIFSYVPHNKMPEVYNEIKFLVLPSKKEGIPTVLLEALACGVIPVVSKVGGMPWLIQKAGVGVVLQDTHFKSIVKILEYLLSLSSKELCGISHKCRIFIEKHFMLTDAVNRYLILTKILK